jgi:hypothetical protein
MVRIDTLELLLLSHGLKLKMQGLIQTGSLNVNGFIWKFNGPIDDFA